MTQKDVHFIITGGTIDSVFDPSADAVIVNSSSVISDYIHQKIKQHGDFSYEILTMKDSRDISDHIREEILRSIEKTPKTAIVITHGTYTMPQTASFIAERFPALAGNKTVVLTGSMYPLKGFSDSDAPFNLGYAIAGAQILPAGVYVAMNGTFFDGRAVEKDTKAARFIMK